MIFSHITDQQGEVASINMPVAYHNDALASFVSLSADSLGAVLLESAEIDSKDNLKSLMLIDAALRIECNGMQVTVNAQSQNGATLLPFLAGKLTTIAKVTQTENSLQLSFSKPDPLLDEVSRLVQPNPFSVLRIIQHQLSSHSKEDFAIMLAGVIGYDMVANVEQLPEVFILPG
jgi:anthranilate synthase component 1